MRWFSDAGSTLKGQIDFTTGKALMALARQGFALNCEPSVSGSTLTISGEGGVALSATNPCIVGVRSNTSGRTAIAYFIANVTVTFGSSSDTDGNLFGISDANWASTMPIFLGVIYD